MKAKLKNNDIINAKRILNEGDYTLVLCNDDEVYTDCERGVKPLLKLISGNINLKGFSAADKVVGRAAAFLYVILEVEEVYAEVMSQTAVGVFSRYGIKFSYDVQTETIQNREGTGICPMEQATKDAENPIQAQNFVKDALAALSEPG